MATQAEKPANVEEITVLVYSKDDFVLIYDDTQEDTLTICKLEKDVFEEDKEVDAVFYEHVKKNRFKLDTNDSLMVKYIVQVIASSEIEQVNEKAHKKTRARKKAAEAQDEGSKIIEINKKMYNSLVATVKKFKVSDSSQDESEQDDESQSVRSKS